MGSWCTDSRPHEASPSGETQMGGDSGSWGLNVSCQEYVVSLEAARDENQGHGAGTRYQIQQIKASIR